MKLPFFKKKYYLGDQSKYLPKQRFHLLAVPHEGTLRSAIKWWVLNKNPHCHSFCPTCKYYYRCQEDVAMAKEYGIEPAALRTNQLPYYKGLK